MPPKISEDEFNTRRRRSTLQSYDTDAYSSYQDYISGTTYDMHGKPVQSGITPKSGWQVDPNNPNAVMQIPGANINSTTLAQGSTLNLSPAPTDNNNYPGITAGGMATIGANQQGFSTTQQPSDSLTDMFKSYLGAQEAPPNSASVYSGLESQFGVDAKQNQANLAAQAEQTALDEFNGYNAQLQGFAAEATAIPIQQQQDATGRGMTAGGLAPHTTAALRNNALRALPVQAAALVSQAKLAAAQGKTRLAQSILDSAQNRVDKIFEIQMQDIENQYKYRQDNRDKVYEFATAKEQARLDAQGKQADRDFSMLQNDLSYARDISKLAMTAGQGDLVGKIAALDPRSKTYSADLGILQGKLASYLASQMKKDGIAAPTVKTINGVDMQWNSSTGQWENIVGNGPGSQDLIQKSKDQLTFLRNTATQAIDLSRASGASGLWKTSGDLFVGDTEFRQLEALTNTLRTNVLTLMTDPGVKKYFGPQMSEADVRLMTAAGTTLNPSNQSPTQLKTEVERLDALFMRMQTAVDAGSAGAVVPASQIPEGYYQASDGLFYPK